MNTKTFIIIVFVTIIIFYSVRMLLNTYYIEPFNQTSIEQIKERVLGLTEKKMLLAENYQNVKGRIMSNYKLNCPKTTSPPISKQDKEITHEQLKTKDEINQIKNLVNEFLNSDDLGL